MLAPQTRITLMRSTQLIVGALLLVAALGLTNQYGLLRIGISIGFVVLAALSLLMGYRGPAVAWVALAVVFNPIVPLTLPRHIWVIIDLVSLAGVVYFTRWATNPYQKGIRFEDYVAKLFPEPGFVIQNRSRDISKFMNRMVESDMHPDLIFRNRKTGKSFAVECKYRGKWAQGNSGELGLWWNRDQGARYSAYEKSSGMPVFVAFGIGGSPEKPKEVYFLESAKLQYSFLKQSFVRSGKSAGEVG